MRATASAKSTKKVTTAKHHTAGGGTHARRTPRMGGVPTEEIRVRGFARIQIGEPQPGGGHRIVGDSGWFKNTLTAEGRNAFLANKVGSLSGSKTPAYLSLGTQTNAVNSTQTFISGDMTHCPTASNGRKSASLSLVQTGTLQMTASWHGSELTAATSTSIGAIQVLDGSGTAAGTTMASGATFTASQWASNQNVSATYLWLF